MEMCVIRDKLIDLLQSYDCKYPEEEVYKRQIIDFIGFHSDCFERSCRLGHITASSFVLNYDASRALLMHHTKLGIWLQLGGHCDGDSNVTAVALKEAQEESGITAIKLLTENIYDIDVHLVPANGDEQAHYHYDIRFLLQVTDPDELVSKNSESMALKWFENDVANLPTKQWSVVRLFEKWSNINIFSEFDKITT